VPAAANIEKLENIKKLLSERSNFVVSTYSGLSITQMDDLRGQIRAKNARLKVLKNNLFHLAVKEVDSNLAAKLKEVLHGPIAVVFAGDDLPALSKVLVDFGKKNDKVQVKAGGMDGEFLDKKGVEAIAGLPGREELLTIIGRGLNTPATKIATGINQIMAGLARGIKAVAEKNGTA
jgi:large subunit ribosomal protein L10